jgi:hypothetical protein
MIRFPMVSGVAPAAISIRRAEWPVLRRPQWLKAVMYTVVQNCKMHGINPEEYLKDVLGRLPHIKADEARELTPAKWLAARSPASRIA